MLHGKDKQVLSSGPGIQTLYQLRGRAACLALGGRGFAVMLLNNR